MDRVRVRLEAPGTVHRATTGLSSGFDLSAVEFNVIERKVLEGDKTGVLVFEVKNADAAVVNALRRIMIAEVETMAVDVVGIKVNTSVIADEILAHRIGLVPFNIDPEKLKKSKQDKEFRVNFDIFKQCLGDNSENDDKLLSKDLKWVADDVKKWPELAELDPPPAPLLDDIVLAKLIPGQSVFLRAQLRIGVGQEHAKFSPVATTSYRLLPVIEVDQERAEPVAKDIKAGCPMDVFDIEDGDKLVVKDARRCTFCRECIRYDEWSGAVTLERDPNHYIFSIEGVGMIDPAEIFKRACRKLAAKCAHLETELATILHEERD